MRSETSASWRTTPSDPKSNRFDADDIVTANDFASETQQEIFDTNNDITLWASQSSAYLGSIDTDIEHDGDNVENPMARFVLQFASRRRGAMNTIPSDSLGTVEAWKGHLLGHCEFKINIV